MLKTRRGTVIYALLLLLQVLVVKIIGLGKLFHAALQRKTCDQTISGRMILSTHHLLQLIEDVHQTGKSSSLRHRSMSMIREPILRFIDLELSGLLQSESSVNRGVLQLKPPRGRGRREEAAWSVELEVSRLPRGTKISTLTMCIIRGRRGGSIRRKSCLCRLIRRELAIEILLRLKESGRLGGMVVPLRLNVKLNVGERYVSFPWLKALS